MVGPLSVVRLVVGSVLVPAVLLIPWVKPFTPSSTVSANAAFQTSNSSVIERAKAGAAAANVHCVMCHKLPSPDVLPRASWRDEVSKMFLIQNKQPEPGGPPGTVSRNVTL